MPSLATSKLQISQALHDFAIIISFELRFASISACFWVYLSNPNYNRVTCTCLKTFTYQGQIYLV